MNLKEQSESDKDLIIYSLNESLEIHKEIVERIQQEKDDLEYYYLQTMREQAEAEQQAKSEAEQAHVKAETTFHQLNLTYQSLLTDLRSKQLEYDRMTTRFDALSHPSHPSSNTQAQIEQMLSQIQSVAQHDLETERAIMAILLTDVFQTEIHPGVSLNRPFGAIYRWMAKRNRAWASRMRQQITLFVVKQSKEERDQIRLAEEAVLDRLMDLVKGNPERLRTIVDLALDLNQVIKCEEDEAIQIITIDSGTAFDPEHMVNVSTGKKDPTVVSCMISPAFVAHTPTFSFMIPARVMCVPK
ncbi:hypothetical protein EDC96DRAFT_346203 [Choanephora cucurbitarum]|nr:hypothetical protein EDC96DRAFT_346203 [Choanephora cucurbitarum]